MQLAPVPKNEDQRLVAVHNLGLLNTPTEKRFDVITKTAISIFHVPISTLTLVDSNREWFKSCQGLSQLEGDRSVSFCGHALLSDGILVIPDTTKDKRFADNPMVIGSPYIRFYAGVPVVSADGQRVGVFCIKDTKPRKFSKEEKEILEGLASWAEVEINSHNLSLALKSQKKLQITLKDTNTNLKDVDKSQNKTNKALLNVMEDLEHAKEQLEIEKAKDEAMLASIGEGLIAVDNDEKVIMLNKAAESSLGLKSSDLIGNKLTSLLLEDSNGIPIPYNKRPTTLALSEGKTVNEIYYFVRKNKTKFPVSITVTPIKIGGKTLGAIEIIRDVTREKEIDKAKSEFVSLASHQLRTPVGIIKWYLESLEDKYYFNKSPVEVQKVFHEIYKSNERVLSLVRDLLFISRIDEGRVRNTPELVDPTQIIKEVVKQMQILAHKKEVGLDLNLCREKIPSINIDALRFREVLENLITNAIEYTGAHGKVEVIVQKAAKIFLISVKDTGIGISELDQSKLFTKFFRSENAVKYNPEGSGLGLYVVKSYVEGWGGKVLVESTEQKGSIFTISLPISEKIDI